MKLHAKISCVAMALTIITVDAFAEPNKNKTFRQKMSGYEFGVGVPVVTPLTGYNVFVGYVNKKADTFWGRRFGIRADFTIPSALKLTGTLSDSTDGQKYVIDGHGKIMGFDVKTSDFKKEKLEIDVIKDDRKNPISIGQDAIDLSLNIKNQNMGVLIDFYPFADTWFLGGLRFSGGYYLGDFKIDVNANVNNDIEYSYKVGNRNDILRAQIASGSRIGADFRWKYHGPYAGMGFDLGIWRGFKFFMDAGVVFSQAPKITDANIHDNDFHLRGSYEIRDSAGNLYSSGSQMVDILNGGSTPPDVDNIVQEAVGMVIQQTLDTYASSYGNVINDIAAAYGVPLNDVDYTDLGSDIVNFLNNNSTAPWISTLTTTYAGTELANTIDDIKHEWKTNAAEATKGIQQDINKAWADYDKAKHDAIDDANDFLKKYGMFPIVKFGFMFRF